MLYQLCGCTGKMRGLAVLTRDRLASFMANSSDLPNSRKGLCRGRGILDKAFRPRSEVAIVQCEGFRCVGFLGPDRTRRNAAGKQLPGFGVEVLARNLHTSLAEKTMDA